MSTPARRNYGSGGLTYDPKRDLWTATLEAGWTTRGTRRRIKISAKTKKVALQKLKDKEREIARNGIPAESARQTMTVKAWSEEWLTITEATLSPKSWRTSASSVKQWIIPTIGHVKLSALSPGHVRSVSTEMLDEGRAPSTALRTHSVLMAMLKAATVEGGHSVPQNLFLITGPSKGESDRSAIPTEHALKILDAALKRPDASRWVAALLQAMRPSEALGLTWGAVDFNARRIDVSWQLQELPYKIAYDRESGFRVPVGYEATQIFGQSHLVRPKTASGHRIIPMVPWVHAALVAWKAQQTVSPHGLVWPDSRGLPKSKTADREEWYALVNAAGVAKEGKDGERPYALYEARHTAATLLREAGVDDETIMAIMGHSTILSTKAYLHTDSARALEALEKVAKKLQLGT